MATLSFRSITRRRVLAGPILTIAGLETRHADAEPRAPFNDVHAHPVVNLRASTMPSVPALLRVMDAHGITRTVLSPPPMLGGPNNPGAYGPAELSPLVRQARDRLAFAAGGEILNGMLQHAPANSIDPPRMQRFRAEATAIARSGAAAFAELGAEVYPAGPHAAGGRTAQTSPPDHPFLLALAEIAADFSMPIGLHMEALAVGAENISALERLLAYNRQARIVWLHAGWDRSGERTVTLMQTLLQRHPNLYMAMKSDHIGNPANAPLDAFSNRMKPEWLALLSAFPDRFVIGSDQFYDSGNYERLDQVRHIIDALPPDLARRIGVENAPRIYRFST